MERYLLIRGIHSRDMLFVQGSNTKDRKDKVMQRVTCFLVNETLNGRSVTGTWTNQSGTVLGTYDT